MRYKAVIFDIDGTILDSEERSLLSLQKGIKKVTGRDYSLEELRFSLGIPGNVTMEILGIEQSLETRKAWHEEFVKIKYMEKMFDGIRETFEALRKRGILMGIVTSRPRIYYAEEFGAYPEASYFKEVICAEDVEHPKPAPDSLIEVMKRFDVKPEETLYVGDTHYDMDCAAAAGVDGALALWGASEPEKISCTWKLSHPLEILEL